LQKLEEKMAKTGRIDVKDRDLLAGLRDFLERILTQAPIKAILVPRRLPMKNMVMPGLITDPQYLDQIDPLSPAFPMNSAKLVSRLSRKSIGGKVAVVLRPCEIRAFVELVKLKQGRRDEVLIIGLDCLGAFKNTDYFRYARKSGEPAALEFTQKAIRGETDFGDGVQIAAACRACDQPVPDGADLVVGLLGVDIDQTLLIEARSPEGEDIFSRLELTGMKVPEGRPRAIEALVAERTAARDDMYSQTRTAVADVEKLTAYLGDCVNCYNCRVACPVCYCKECVFVTDVFNHDPAQYLAWADRKGAIKMPTDTVFYHLTRLAHMSTACVGCGQCSNACPNDIPVMELFRTVAHRTQAAFGYLAGRDIEEKPPLSEFREKEFEEVVGIDAQP
jgi:formate dehydrogenase subunit beta